MSARRVPSISPALLHERDRQTEMDMEQSMGAMSVNVQLMDLPLELLVHIGNVLHEHAIHLFAARDLAPYSATCRALHAAFAARRISDIHYVLHANASSAQIKGSEWARLLTTPGLDINRFAMTAVHLPSGEEPVAMTALMTACAMGYVENVRWLRIFGADPELRDGRNGRTASQIADDADARRVSGAVWCRVAMEKDRPKLLFMAMDRAIEKGDHEELSELLELDGADANAVSEHEGMSLLHLACHGSVERGRHCILQDAEAFVRLLLQKGANNFDQKDRNGHRSVDDAAGNGLQTCVELLRAAGAPEPSKDAIIVGKEIALQRERDFARLRDQFEGWDEDEEGEEY